MESVDVHRLQFGFTAAFHYLFPQLTMGLALLILILKTMALRGDEEANRAARFWAKVFGLGFAFGVVTGIPMEFQFGTNWARFSRASGGIIGQTLAMEGVFAFFLEAAFLYFLLYGEKRLGPRGHWAAALLVFLGSWLSGYFIICTNAWMQHPVGYVPGPNGSTRLTSLWALLSNPWALVQYLHNMAGAAITGSFVMAGIGAVAESWPQLGKKLPGSKVLRRDLELLLKMYQLYGEQEKEFRSELIRLARKEEPVRRFCEVPGFGWVRAVTFYVYIDTPARFASKSKLWRYCGLGLEKRGSGQGPLRTRLCRQGNRSLKGVLIGAAQSVIGGDGPYAQQYQFWTRTQGLPPHTARRNLARHLATTLWSLWKEGGRYDPARVCRRPIAEGG
jgi:hypothetical protein